MISRLAELLEEIGRHCAKFPTEQPAIDSPALTLLLLEIGELSSLLGNADALCREHKLAGDAESFLAYQDKLDNFADDIIRLVDGKLRATDYTGFLGNVALVAQHVSSMRSVRRAKRNRKGEATDNDTLTPPQIAKQLRVSPDTVLGWIGTGQLKASNLATGKRPRWIIKRADLDTFLQSRERQPDWPVKRRKRQASGFKKYRD